MSAVKNLKRKLGKVSGAKLLTIGFVSAFAAVGAYMLIYTHAATSSVAFEPEKGNTSSQVSTGSDTKASNGQYTQFGSGQCPAGQTGTPPNCQPSGGGSGAILVGAGDIAECSSQDDEKTATLVTNVLNANAGAVVFTAGDNAYPNGASGDYTNCYNPSWGAFKGKTKPDPGNHEWKTANAGGYFGYFGNAFGNSTTDWYSYNLGGWHIIMLDSNCSNINCTTETTWLKNDLAASSAACTVAMWHHPVFNIGHHDTAGDTSKGKPFWQALDNAGADLIINGHDHNYQRWKPQRVDGTLDATNGIREIVVGTGGASAYAFTRTDTKVEAKSTGTAGVLKLTLKSNSYDWQFIPVAGGSFTDSGTGSCH